MKASSAWTARRNELRASSREPAASWILPSSDAGRRVLRVERDRGPQRRLRLADPLRRAQQRLLGLPKLLVRFLGCAQRCHAHERGAERGESFCT